jgi:hypothetical protein
MEARDDETEAQDDVKVAPSLSLIFAAIQEKRLRFPHVKMVTPRNRRWRDGI